MLYVKQITVNQTGHSLDACALYKVYQYDLLNNSIFWVLGFPPTSSLHVSADSQGKISGQSAD